MSRYDRGVTRRVRLLSDLVAERDEILEEKVYLRGVHPPDKICTRCRAECGPRIDAGHDTLCDACAAMPTVDPEKFWMQKGEQLEAKVRAIWQAHDLGLVVAVDEQAERTHAIDCDMDEDCTCGAEPCDHMTDDCTCPPDAP